MLNKKTGRPKKYNGEPRLAIVINIIKPWREIAKKLEILSQIDEDPNFKAYCSSIEGSKVENKGENKLSTYCRYVLTKHVLSNQTKLLAAENK